MDRAFPRARLRAIAAGTIAVGGLLAVGGVNGRSAGSAPSTTAPAGPTTSAAPTFVPTSTLVTITVDDPADSAPVETDPGVFSDGAEASSEAEGLISPYIESEMSVAVTDVACSTPATGAEGETFVCYGLKPDNLVIALRVTIGTQRQLTLELVTDQQPPPTDPPTSSSTP